MTKKREMASQKSSGAPVHRSVPGANIVLEMQKQRKDELPVSADRFFCGCKHQMHQQQTQKHAGWRGALCH